MKKKWIAIVCTAVMLLCLLPQTVLAAGSLEGVDYSRIHGTGSRATLTLGELEFEGQLSRGKVLSQSEQDKIIKQTMNDMNITSGMLLSAKTMLDAAHKLEGFNLKDITDALLKLAGVDNYIDLYKHITGSKEKTSTQIAADIAKGQMVGYSEDGMEGILTNGGTVALKGAGKFAFKLLFMLPDLADIGFKSLEKYENIKETIAGALEKQMMLDAFYDECNRRIDDAAGKSGAWQIRFQEENTQTYNCTFWSVSGVMMEASLSGVLEQVSEIDGAAGQYRGTLSLKIEGVDMEYSFDAKVPDSPMFGSDLHRYDGFVGLNNNPGAEATVTLSHQTTVLKRRMQGEVSVMITAGDGTQVSEVSGSLTSGADETEFSFEHAVTYTFIAKHIGVNETTVDSYVSTDPEICHRTYTGETFAPGVGTVWKPLESKPFITVYYEK